MHTYSKSSKLDHPKEEISKSYNLRKFDKWNPNEKKKEEQNHNRSYHTNKKEQKRQKEGKNKPITDGVQRKLSQIVRKPLEILNLNF